MKRISTSLFVIAVMMLLCNVTTAQRPRKISDPPKPLETEDVSQTEQKEKQNTSANNTNQEKNQTQNATQADTQNVKVKYEGGVFGYRQKMNGWLWFDDVNERLVFRDEQQKEVFSIPYDAISAAFADTQSRRPTAATVIGSSVPYGLGLPALFIKKKYRYLTLQYNDADVSVAGVTSFKVGTKELLEQALKTLANKAKLTPKGDIYIRRRQPPKDTSQENKSG
jgi:hypothetical protein